MTDDLMKRGPRVLECYDITDKTQLNVAVTSAAVTYITSIPDGVYSVWCDQSAAIRVAATSVPTSVGNGFIVHANDHHLIYIPGNYTLSATAAAAGTTVRLFNID